MKPLKKLLEPQHAKFFTTTIEVFCRKWWERPQHTHFTIHDVTHSQRVMQRLDEWLLWWPGSLTPQESFRLVAAIYLHDIGMQCDSPSFIAEYAKELDIDMQRVHTMGRSAMLSYEDKELIRKHHPSLSRAMILDACANPASHRFTRLREAGLDCGNFYKEFQDIAILSEAHAGPINQEIHKRDDIRFLLLAYLLRIGDSFDADRTRIPTDFVRDRWTDLDPKEKYHLLKHHFVSRLEIKPAGVFRFHLELPDEASDIKESVIACAEGSLAISLTEAGRYLRTFGIPVWGLEYPEIASPPRLSRGARYPLEPESKQLFHEEAVRIRQRQQTSPPISRRQDAEQQEVQRAHEPIAIILGDRREVPPESPGDFFAASPSPRDITWLMTVCLSESTVIWNDKVISAVTDPEDIPHFVKDRDLIIIGSPYCNLFARKVNPTAFFRFNLNKHNLQRISNFESKILGCERNDPLLKEYYDDLKRNHGYDELVMLLRGDGFVDPIRKLGNVGSYAGKDADYATVCFCEHPFSSTHRALLVAGLHLPGTMAAVLKLSDADFFQGHPLGGIMKVEIPKGEWYERVTRASCSWFTSQYTLDEYLRALDTFGTIHESHTIELSDVEQYRRNVDSHRDMELAEFLRRMNVRTAKRACHEA